MKIHVTGGRRGDVHDLTISIQGKELDIINLIDDLDWAAGVGGNAVAARLRALRKAITDTVGLVRDIDNLPAYHAWRPTCAGVAVAAQPTKEDAMSTITVAELLERLDDFGGNLPVVIEDGACFGGYRCAVIETASPQGYPVVVLAVGDSFDPTATD